MIFYNLKRFQIGYRKLPLVYRRVVFFGCGEGNGSFGNAEELGNREQQTEEFSDQSRGSSKAATIDV